MPVPVDTRRPAAAVRVPPPRTEERTARMEEGAHHMAEEGTLQARKGAAVGGGRQSSSWAPVEPVGMSAAGTAAGRTQEVAGRTDVVVVVVVVVVSAVLGTVRTAAVEEVVVDKLRDMTPALETRVAGTLV